jgi:hypothetical protein
MNRWGRAFTLFFILMAVLTGTAVAQMDPGPYHILHRDGAVYNSDTGWTLSSPPYFPGADWVVDFTYNSQGMSILHKDGAIWNSSSGWILSSPPYYAGSAYAKAMEYLRDVTGCWGMSYVEYTAEYDAGEGVYELQRNSHEFPDLYIDIQNQYGTRLEGQVVGYKPMEGCMYLDLEGTINGDHFSIVAEKIEGAPGEQCQISLNAQGVVTWNDIESRWEIKGNIVGCEVWCDQGNPTGFFGVFVAWPETTCTCPPPD